MPAHPPTPTPCLALALALRGQLPAAHKQCARWERRRSNTAPRPMVDPVNPLTRAQQGASQPYPNAVGWPAQRQQVLGRPPPHRPQGSKRGRTCRNSSKCRSRKCVCAYVCGSSIIGAWGLRQLCQVWGSCKRMAGQTHPQPPQGQPWSTQGSRFDWQGPWEARNNKRHTHTQRHPACHLPPTPPPAVQGRFLQAGADRLSIQCVTRGQTCPPGTTVNAVDQAVAYRTHIHTHPPPAAGACCTPGVNQQGQAVSTAGQHRSPLSPLAPHPALLQSCSCSCAAWAHPCRRGPAKWVCVRHKPPPTQPHPQYPHTQAAGVRGCSTEPPASTRTMPTHGRVTPGSPVSLPW